MRKPGFPPARKIYKVL